MRRWLRRAGRDEIDGPSWRQWSQEDVVDAGAAEFVVRTYLEQEAVRRHLRRAAAQMEIGSLADVGAGYGRLSLVLQEFGRVVAFEREPEFVSAGRALLPQEVEFRQIRTLSRLPAESRSFDFVLTFTVLQHTVDAVFQAACGEIKRVLRRGGFVLLCEETDESHVDGDLEDPEGRCTIGRTVERYRRTMAPLTLVASEPRRIEPTYPRADVGTYMLFRDEG
jgi:SAM-dependent methyltransferase